MVARTLWKLKTIRGTMPTNTLLTILLSLLLSLSVRAEVPLLERSYTIESEKESTTEAKKEIQDKAIMQIVEELGVEVLGEARYAKRKSSLNTSLAQKSARFIPFSNITESKLVDKKLKQTVLYKINLAEFRNILKAMGQLEEIDKNQSILPLIHFENMISQRAYSWWHKDDDSLAKTALVMENKLGEVFLRGGFYLSPANEMTLSEALPSGYNKSQLNNDEILKLARLLQTPYVLSGNVVIKRSEKQMNMMRIELHLNLIQAENGKTLADIKRVYEQALPKDNAKVDDEISKRVGEDSESVGAEIVSLMTDALQRGLINSQKMKLKFAMASQPQKIEVLKEQIKAQNSNIKNVKEKSISANSVTFEIDFIGSLKDIQDKILAMDVKNLSYLKVELTSSQVEEMDFELKQ